VRGGGVPRGGGLGKERRGGAATSNPLPPPPIYLYTKIPLLPVINKWGERGGGWVFAKQRKGPSRMGKDAGSWAKRKKPLAYLRFINISPPPPPPPPNVRGSGRGVRGA